MNIALDYPLLPKQMPDRIKSVWRKSEYIAIGIFLLIGIAGTGFLRWVEALEGFWLWVVGIYFVTVLLGSILSILFIPYRYQFNRYDITSENLSFQKGYLFRSTTHVPINRIQHIEVEQGPLLRRENLMEIVVHTAATNHHIAGLDAKEAIELRKQILELVRADDENV